MYKYFELDIVVVCDNPVTPVKLIDKPTSKGVETSQVQKACLDKNQKQQNVYHKEYNIYYYKKKD